MINGVLALLTCIFMMTTDFTRTSSVTVPKGNNKKVVRAPQQSKPNPVFAGVGNGINGMGKGVGNAAQGAGKGAGWFFGELLRPFDAMRNGLIDAFGVKEPAQRKR